MGFIPNQNLTLGIIQTDVTLREVTVPSSAGIVNSTIVALGVLTFTLQLCFALLFMLRCWRLERRVQEALKQPDSLQNLSELPYIYPESYKQKIYLFYKDSPAVPSHTTSSAMENYKDSADYVNSPSLPWDLVQN